MWMNHPPSRTRCQHMTSQLQPDQQNIHENHRQPIFLLTLLATPIVGVILATAIVLGIGGSLRWMTVAVVVAAMAAIVVSILPAALFSRIKFAAECLRFSTERSRSARTISYKDVAGWQTGTFLRQSVLKLTIRSRIGPVAFRRLLIFPVEHPLSAGTDLDWAIGASNSATPVDVRQVAEALRTGHHDVAGVRLRPVYVRGGWPAIVEQSVDMLWATVLIVGISLFLVDISGILGVVAGVIAFGAVVTIVVANIPRTSINVDDASIVVESSNAESVVQRVADLHTGLIHPTGRVVMLGRSNGRRWSISIPVRRR